jgi:hypothetical protein
VQKKWVDKLTNLLHHSFPIKIVVIKKKLIVLDFIGVPLVGLKQSPFECRMHCPHMFDLFYIYLTRQVSEEKSLIYNDSLGTVG